MTDPLRRTNTLVRWQQLPQDLLPDEAGYACQDNLLAREKVFDAAGQERWGVHAGGV